MPMLAFQARSLTHSFLCTLLFLSPSNPLNRRNQKKVRRLGFCFALIWGFFFMEMEKNMQQDVGDFDGEGNEDEEVKLKYSSRKIFLQSYPLLWEKEIERLTLIKSLQRRLRIVVAKILLLKKLKPKIAGSAFLVGSCSSRSFNLQMTLFEASNKPEPLKI